MRFGLFISFVALMVSCRDKGVVVDTTTNNPPIADAGPDQSLSADQEIRLDGGSSFDPDGDPMSFYWSFSHVPEGSTLSTQEGAFSINHASSSTTTFVPDLMGTYIVALVVTDSKGADSIADSVIISVSEGTLPTANAGPDQNSIEDQLVTLDGSASSDPLNRPLSYSWSISSAPPNSTASLIDENSAMASFTPDVSGNYLLSLVVDSGFNVSLPDVMILKVASSNPQAPTASAVATGALSDCTNIQLDGSTSSDPNEDQLSYFWVLQEKPMNSNANDAYFSDRTAEKPTFYADVAGEYLISLAVNDGLEWSSPALVPLNISERATNGAPAVNAGNAMTVDAGDAECEAGAYSSYTCNSCEDMTITLGQGAAVNDPDGDRYTVMWSVLDGDASISDETSLQSSITFRNAEPEQPGSCSHTAYEIQLAATDCPGFTSTDTVIFTVNCCGITAQ